MGIRQQKISAQIRRLVSEVIQREIADPRVTGLISVTKVEVTPDLKEAKIYVSIFGQKGPVATVLHGLEDARPHVQTVVAKGLHTRTAPHIEFRLDDSLKREAELLRQINEVAAADASLAKEKGENTTVEGGGGEQS